MAENRIYQPYLNPLQPVSPNYTTKTKIPLAPPNAVGGTFQKVLEQEQKTIKFSKHAIDRLQDRNIKLNETQMDKLYEAVDKAEKKGARESLVLFKEDLALVVSVKNRTVITAIDGESMKENVFTNIDSAVII
jgi:flagellar operon protein